MLVPKSDNHMRARKLCNSRGLHLGILEREELRGDERAGFREASQYTAFSDHARVRALFYQALLERCLASHIRSHVRVKSVA